MDLALEDAELVADGENLDLQCGFGLPAEDKEIEQRADDGVKEAQDHGQGSWRPVGANVGVAAVDGIIGGRVNNRDDPFS